MECPYLLSYVYGDEIYTTIYLSEIDRFYSSSRKEIWVIASRRIIDEAIDLLPAEQIQELDNRRLTNETYKTVFQQQGAYRLFLHE